MTGLSVCLLRISHTYLHSGLSDISRRSGYSSVDNIMISRKSNLLSLISRNDSHISIRSLLISHHFHDWAVKYLICLVFGISVFLSTALI